MLGKISIVTGGDSGIGQASAFILAKEGSDVVVVYLNEHEDAKITQQLAEKQCRTCLLIAGDLGNDQFCKKVVEATIKQFGRVDVIVNNAGEQHPQKSIEDITNKQLEKTFRTNIFSFFI